MARLPMLDHNAMPPDLAALLATRPPYNIYRVLAHAPTALARFIPMAGALLNEGELDAQWRELAILRVGALCRSAYEIHQHLRLARLVGTSEARVAHALNLETPMEARDELAPADRAILAFTDAVARDVKAPAALYQDVRALLSDRALTELLMVIGFYMMVSRLLENLEVDLEAQDIDLSNSGYYTRPA